MNEKYYKIMIELYFVDINLILTDNFICKIQLFEYICYCLLTKYLSPPFLLCLE